MQSLLDIKTKLKQLKERFILETFIIFQVIENLNYNRKKQYKVIELQFGLLPSSEICLEFVGDFCDLWKSDILMVFMEW